MPEPSGPPDPAHAYPIDPEPHTDWARGIAHRALKKFRIPLGSEDAYDLECEALVALCAAAARFEPARVKPDSTETEAFRGWAHRGILTACCRAAAKIRRRGVTHIPRDLKTGRPLKVDVRFAGEAIEGFEEVQWRNEGSESDGSADPE